MIKRIISLLKKNTEFILYAFFGVITALISFSVFYLCNTLFGNDFYLLNNAVAWFCAVTFACFTNKFFVFKSESIEPKVIIREIVVFYSSRIMTLAIEEIGLQVHFQKCPKEGEKFVPGVVMFKNVRIKEL